MRVFKNGNWLHGNKCPICSTSKDGVVVLVGIEGTQEGFNIQATQVHLDCLELTFKKGAGDTRDIIYQVIVPKEDN